MIRLAKMEEMNEILRIYEAARAFMRKSGNPTQWAGGYPNEDVLTDDINKNQLYVIESDGGICAAFALIDGIDPTYSVIEGGEWMSDSPYGTIHRVATDGSVKGLFAKCVEFARERYDHLRIDTHEDNKPMQHVVTKNGFEYRGIIYLENGDPRLAYEWME